MTSEEASEESGPDLHTTAGKIADLERRRYEAVLGDSLPLVVPGRLTDASTYVVRVSAKNRADADALCARLRAAGGACIVLSNPRS